MAYPATPLERNAVERAMSIITAFCTIITTDDPEHEPTSVALYEIIEDLGHDFLRATTKEEEKAAQAELTRTIVALACVINALLEHSAIDMDKFELISLIAQTFHRSYDQ